MKSSIVLIFSVFLGIAISNPAGAAHVHFSVAEVTGEIDAVGFTLMDVQANLECHFLVGRARLSQYPFQGLRTSFKLSAAPTVSRDGVVRHYRVHVSGGRLTQRKFRAHNQSCAYVLRFRGNRQNEDGALSSVFGKVVLAGSDQQMTKEEIEEFYNSRIEEAVMQKLNPLLLDGLE